MPTTTAELEEEVKLGLYDLETNAPTPMGAALNNARKAMPDDAEGQFQAVELFRQGMIQTDLTPTQKGAVAAGGREEALKTKQGMMMWRYYGFEQEYEDNKEKGPGLWESVKHAANDLLGLPKTLKKYGVIGQVSPELPRKLPGDDTKLERDGKIKITPEHMGIASRDEKVVAFDTMYKTTAFNNRWLKNVGRNMVMGSGAKLGLVSDDEWNEGQRINELALSNIDDFERGKAATFVAALTTDLDDDELLHVRDAVQAAAGRLNEAGTLAQTDKEGAVMTVATDLSNLGFEAVTAGAGGAIAMGRYAVMANTAGKLARVEARVAEAAHAIEVLAPKRAMLEKLATNGMTPASRARAAAALATTDATIATAQAAADVATKAGQELMKAGPISKVGDSIRKIGAWFPETLGKGVEKAGEAVIKADAVGGSKLGTALNVGRGVAKVGGLIGAAGAVGAGSPVGAGIAALVTAAGFLKKGELVSRLGRNIRILGAEFLAGRSPGPYWARVAQEVEGPLASAVAKTMDIAGRTPLASVVKGAGAGSAVGYGLGLAGSGGDADQAAAMAGGGAVFGAIGGVGGAIMKGSQRTFAVRGIENAQKFRRLISDVDQLAHFDGIPTDAQRVVGNFAAIYPDLNIEFRPGHSSKYSDDTGTIYIDPKSKNPLKPLVAHEVGHYIVESGMRDTIALRLVGDADRGIGGLVKDASGKLDPDFAAFKAEYNRRAVNEGHAPKDDASMAIEYAIEGYVDELVGANLSGELTKKAAGKTMLGKMGADWFADTIPDSVITARFLRHGGTVSDANGRFVPGSGLLTKGVRSYPEVNRMLRIMTNRMAGKRSKNVVKIDPKTGMKTVDGSGVPYGEWVNDKAMHQQIKGSLLQDANGEVVYRGGAPVPLSKRQLDASNALIGSQVIKALNSLTPDEVLALPDGHVKFNDDGSVGGRFISDEILAKIDTAGILNPSQVDNLRAVNAILKDFDGSPMSVMYQAAIETKGSARNKKRGGSIAPAIKNIVPYGFEITAAGNVNIRLVDIVKIADNAQRYIKTGQGKRLYGTDVQGGVTKIMRDLEKHMDNWGNRESNADYWAAQEGGSMAKGKDKRDFLNAVSGYTTGDQVKVNPFMDAAPLPGGEKAVKGTTAVRTYRVDRINSVYKLQGSKFHYGYESAKQNLLPEPAWHGTPHKIGEEGFSMDKIGTGEGAQAYGHGLYFAGREAVAKTYFNNKKEHAYSAWLYDDTPLTLLESDEMRAAALVAEEMEAMDVSFSDAKETVADDVKNNRSTLKTTIETVLGLKEERFRPPGNLYKVHLKPKTHEFLDWDKPLSEQSELVRKQLGDLGVLSERKGDKIYEEMQRQEFKERYGERPDAMDPIRSVGQEKQASNRLHKAGIKGIRYLDGNSRGKGEGSYNYVIFDDADVVILEENGKPVTGKARDEALRDMHEQGGAAE
jgi:hypothetical protein